jgi:hypothetical protein
MGRERSSRSHSPQHKRQKVAHDTKPPAAEADGAKKPGAELCAENLAAGLLTDENVERLRKEYANNEPFKYARVETLFQDDLLKKVKEECLSRLSFTEKETDIYRVSPRIRSVSAIYDPAPFFGGLRVWVSVRVLSAPPLARASFSRAYPSPLLFASEISF